MQNKCDCSVESTFTCREIITPDNMGKPRGFTDTNYFAWNIMGQAIILYLRVFCLVYVVSPKFSISLVLWTCLSFCCLYFFCPWVLTYVPVVSTFRLFHFLNNWNFGSGRFRFKNCFGKSCTKFHGIFSFLWVLNVPLVS